MRVLCAMVAVLLLLPAAVAADSFLLFSEPNVDLCAKGTTGFVPVTVYVMHVATLGSIGSAFKIDDSSGLTHLASSFYGFTIIGGDPYSGVYLLYGSCLTGTFPVCQLQFFNGSGQPVPGCYQLTVQDHPMEGAVYAYDCDQTPIFAGSGAYFTFDIEGKPCFDCDIAVEETTWGGVKALYR